MASHLKQVLCDLERKKKNASEVNSHINNLLTFKLYNSDLLLKMWLLFIVVCTVGECLFICLMMESL